MSRPVCAGCGKPALGSATVHVDGCGRFGVLVDGHVQRDAEALQRLGVDADAAPERAPAPEPPASEPGGG